MLLIATLSALLADVTVLAQTMTLAAPTDPVDVLVAAALVAALVQLIRRAGLPARWAGLAAALLGFVAGLVGAVDGGWLAGLVAGLTASGAYSAGKAAGGPAHPSTDTDQQP